MTEAQLGQTIIEAALFYGFQVCHFRPARSERGWRTPVQGHKGFPDLVISGGGVLLLAELKAGRGRLTPEQELWRAAIPAENYRLWRDTDLAAALAELKKLSPRIKNRRPISSGGPDARSRPE